ncbi:related to MUP1 - High affinity methionine permease [Cephalotrichum gorgonifer]|uniref:Related to MUP1 - High affinity methionine permease n=1 Tax=Cephalotrichum gorgonifer TaxID=2041049 RepID=A0AAE8N6N0_9PEZI|nr:related to MUP1 - High affinity methionine permease [Cephalotrichum gorgonifer]
MRRVTTVEGIPIPHVNPNAHSAEESHLAPGQKPKTAEDKTGHPSRLYLRMAAGMWRSLQYIGICLHFAAHPRPPSPDFVRRIPSTIAKRKGKFNLQFYTPRGYKDGDGDGDNKEKKYPVVVNFHGGGFTLGAGTDDGRFARFVVERCGAVFVSVDYRLAPEYPFPTAVEDGADALLYVARHARELRLDARRIATSGFSAGGNLAITAPLRLYDYLRREGKEAAAPEHKIVAVAAWYPVTDYTLTRADRRASAKRPDQTLPPIMTNLFDAAYLDPPDLDLANPFLSPSRATDELLVGGLPEDIIVYTCEWDMLLKEGEEFAARLAAEPVCKRVQYRMIEEVPHGWDKGPSPISPPEGAEEVYGECCERLKRVFESVEGSYLPFWDMVGFPFGGAKGSGSVLSGQPVGKDDDVPEDRPIAVDDESVVGHIQQAREAKRQIGIPSATLLILNRIIGTGIFATPGSILALSGSVGLSLMIWVVGMVIAAAGMAVYTEFGTAIPKNGGEKNYLEYVFRKPRFLATGFYTGYVVLLGWAASNSVAFGEYILHAANVEVTRWNQRGIGLACITSAFLIHGLALKWGLRLQNLLGIIKLIIILIIVVAGWVALAGHVKLDVKPDNFTNAFEGTTGSAYGVVTALYNVIWSYIGYSNANYALSETKNPVRTLKIAAPLALGLVSVLYMLVNIAYFAAVPKEEILEAQRLVAASLFRNVLGAKAERALSVFVALSAFGNVLSVIFSQGRLVQELGREGILPFSPFFASNRPFNAPLAGLFEHWVVSVIIMLAPPPGDAYNFILNLISYPLAVVNTFVSIGLLHLYLNRKAWAWNPPISATLPVVAFFLLSNVYLVIAPFVPPSDGQNIYNSLPYWIHCVVGFALIIAGGLYWVVWAVILPKLGNYELVRETVVDDIDGWERHVFKRKPL